MRDLPEAASAIAVLSRAREQLRARTRQPSYFDRADRFAAVFVGEPLGVSSDACKAIGADLPALLDTCYDELVPLGERAVPRLRGTTAAIQRELTLSPAARSIPSLESALSAPTCPFVDLARTLIGALATLGHASLSRKASPAVADAWLSLWADRVGRHDRQQEIHVGLSLLGPLDPGARERVVADLGIAPAALRPKSGTFARAAEEYVSMFSDTSAAAVALVGALPFAERLGPDDLTSLVGSLRGDPEILTAMNEAFRLAQDVRFDASEPLSSGVFALAAERGCSVADVDASKVATEHVEPRLRTVWESRARGGRARMEMWSDCIQNRPAAREALLDVTGKTWSIAGHLAGASRGGEAPS